jgi:5-methylcytosine-specific restriction endonuclease McrA
LRRAILRRAGGRCEDSGLAQAGQEAQFHVDHIVPVADGGASSLENLALACISCSLRKGARRTALDPQTEKPAPLFHPRRQAWSDHFRWAASKVVGRTAIAAPPSKRRK